jgi:hypothetical protein
MVPAAHHALFVVALTAALVFPVAAWLVAVLVWLVIDLHAFLVGLSAQNAAPGLLVGALKPWPLNRWIGPLSRR